MPKPATGEVRWSGGAAIARVTLRGKERVSITLPTCATEGDALARARLLANIAQRLRAASIDRARATKALELVATASAKSLRNALAVVEELAGGQLEVEGAPAVPTFQEIAKQWTSGELREKYPDQVRAKRTAAEDVGRLTRYVNPILGCTPIDQVTLDQCEQVMRSLPADLSVPTRRNIGHMMVKVMRLAVYPLRHIERSPIPAGFLPSVTKRKAFAYLYPDEDRRLLACTSIALPYRLLWGFLAREGMREGEALALTWEALNLDRGAVRLDKNKTDDPRAWALDPGVVAALSAYRKQHRPNAEPGDRVFTDPAGRTLVGPGLAVLLRQHLRAIGLEQERPELFTTTAERQRMRVHDLRGTFVTISLANGRSEAWISDRTGHRSSNMIARYKRTARTFAELQNGELDPLGAALPELAIAPGLPTSESRDNATLSSDARKPLKGQRPRAEKAAGVAVTPTRFELVLPT